MDNPTQERRNEVRRRRRALKRARITFKGRCAAMQHMQLFEEQGTLQRGTRTAEKRDTKLAKLGGFRPCRGLSSGI
jgi:hypothetical protein